MQKQTSIKFLTIELVTDIHADLVKSAKLVPGYSCENVLKLCLETVSFTLSGERLYHSGLEKGIFYCYYLTKKRPFNDGNKRVAIECWKKFQEINEYSYTEEELKNIKHLVKLIGCDMITKEDLLYFSRCFQANEWGRCLLSKP